MRSYHWWDLIEATNANLVFSYCTHHNTLAFGTVLSYSPDIREMRFKINSSKGLACFCIDFQEETLLLDNMSLSGEQSVIFCSKCGSLIKEATEPPLCCPNWPLLILWQGINQGCPFSSICDLREYTLLCLPLEFQMSWHCLVPLVPFSGKARIHLSLFIIHILWPMAGYYLLLSHTIFILKRV